MLNICLIMTTLNLKRAPAKEFTPCNGSQCTQKEHTAKFHNILKLWSNHRHDYDVQNFSAKECVAETAKCQQKLVATILYLHNCS